MKNKAIVIFLLVLICIISFSSCDQTEIVDPTSTVTTTTATETSDNDTNVPTHTHAWSEWSIVVNATCINEGKQERICACGEQESQTIPATDHTVVVDAEVAATCTSAGKSEGKHCSVCNFVLIEQVPIPRIEHTYDDEKDEQCNVCKFVRKINCDHTITEIMPAVSPTCTSDGLTEGKKCANCDVIISEQIIIKAKGHIETVLNAVDPTCTNTGKTENLCGLHCAFQ